MFDLINCSNYLKPFNSANIKVIGKVKYEFKEEISIELVGLKSKMYSLVSVDGEKNEKAKWVNEHVHKKIRHKELLDALFHKKVVKHNMKRIQSKLSIVGTYDVFNIVLFWW